MIEAERPFRSTGPDPLAAFVHARRRLVVLTGAGISTASGIPDYRDADGQWKRPPPMTWQAFSAGEGARRRYWARSLLGWPRIAAATPSVAHLSLARLELEDRIALLVTQNVDGLHQRAGSRRVVDLHGRLDRVVCLDCRQVEPRGAFQRRLLAANQEWPWLPGRSPEGTADGHPRGESASGESRASPPAATGAGAAPDGDADLDGVDFDAFSVPTCSRCGGVLKPDVVFFGESVPRDRVAMVYEAIDQADGLLVVGSSLMVFSGWRFVRDAAAKGLPVAAVNLGSTRADDLLSLKILAKADLALGGLWADDGSAPFPEAPAASASLATHGTPSPAGAPPGAATPRSSATPA